MSLNFNIARRYLFGKKSTNAINIISGISVLGICLCTAALILILSVFNGFESLLSNIFNAFNPDLKVSAIKGKRFSLDDDTYKALLDINGIKAASKTIEEIALFEYKDQQQIGIVKGVDSAFVSVTGIDSTLLAGGYNLKQGTVHFGLFGLEMANKLSLNISDRLSEVKVYMPLQKNILPGSKEFKIKDIYPAGVYSVKNSDEYQYVLCDYRLVNSLLQSRDQNSYLEIKLDPDASEQHVKSEISAMLGDNFRIQNKYEQEETYLKIIKIEKWVSYLIASLTIVLIVFNLIGSLWMIVLDKKKDLSVLQSMGMSSGSIRSIILNLGGIVTLIGLALGLLLAIIIYIIQSQMGLISVPDGFMIDAYPVKLKSFDFMIVSVTVFILGVLASCIPAMKAAKIPAFIREE